MIALEIAGTLAKAKPAVSEYDNRIDADLLAYCLSGIILHEQARQIAEDAGPSLFPRGPWQDLAGALVLRRPFVPRSNGVAYRAKLEHIVKLLTIYAGPDVPEAVPNTPAWAMDLLATLAAIRYRPLLATELRCVADAVERGDNIGHVRARVGTAFAIAAGREGFGVGDTWAAWDAARSEAA